MTDDSPWPERERTQHLLFAAGTGLLLPVALSFAGLVDLGGTVVVGSAAVASALLIYGLLGWAGNWVAAGDPEVDAGPDVTGGGDGPDPAGDGPVD